MLWRALKSPLRCLPEGRLLQGPYPSTSINRTRFLTQALAGRQIHHQTATDAPLVPPLIRHERLLAESGNTDNIQLDKSIKVAGLVRSVRKQKKIAFARISDGSTLANIQAVFRDPQLAKE
jgi:hypothetical protein